MKLLIDGQMYEFDGRHMQMDEAIELQERTGLGLISFEAEFAELKPVALKWVAYLAKKRAGEQVSWDAFNFDLAAMVADLLSAEAETDALDPTKPTSPPSATPPDGPTPDGPEPTTS